MKNNTTQQSVNKVKAAARRISWLLAFVFISFTSMAQNMRGFYVNGFDNILGNTSSETALLTYAQANNYNYLCLYSLGSVDLTSTTVKNKLASFISRAKTQYGVTQVGAAGEIYSFFANYIIPYNAGRSVATEKIDVLNFEFEFWIASTVASQYCSQYLTPNHLSCDSAGAFAFAKSQFTSIDNAAAANGLMSEVYFGWPNKGQMQWFAQRADRILLHAYRVSDSDIYTYTKNRLIDIASVNTVVNVMIIFSSESEYMGPWLNTHTITQPYETYAAAFAAETGSWKDNIKLTGYQWFKYSTMPPTAVAVSAAISANGPTSFCSGGSVTLSVTSGTADSYQWTKNSGSILGATSASYTATSSGDYAVKITKAGTPATSSSITVNASSTIPQPVVTASGPLSFCPGGNVVLTSSSTSGNRWSTGETTTSITATAAGNYSVTVTSGSCSSTSAQTAVAIINTPATPVITANGSTKICPGTGVVLTSSLAASGGYTWSTGETTRSILAQSAGSYWVRTGNSTCYAQSSNRTVTMKSAPYTPVITVNGSTNLGSSGSVKLTSSSAWGYQWTNGASSKSITVTTAGVYNVTVTGYNGCKATSANKIVTSDLCEPPPVPVITSNSGNNILTSGNSITLTATTSAVYLWSNGQNTQSITVTTPGIYTVRSLNLNGNNCYAVSMPVTVYSEDAIGRQSFDYAEEVSMETMVSYPNPAHGAFNIAYNSDVNEQGTLIVCDMSGRIVNTQHITTTEGKNIIQLDASSLAPGLYLARLTSDVYIRQVRIVVE